MNLNFRRLLPLFAVATGVALVSVTSAFKEVPKNGNDQSFHYYQFNSGADDNHADLVSNWTEISASQYSDASCNGQQRACVIKATDELSSVPCTQETGYKNPYADGTEVVEVKNRVTD